MGQWECELYSILHSKWYSQFTSWICNSNLCLMALMMQVSIADLRILVTMNKLK